MVRKKEIVNIFKEYEKVLLEQVVGDKVSSLLNRVKSSSLDSNTKNELIEILNNNSNTPEQEIPEQGFPKQGLKMKNPFFKGDAGPQGRNYRNQRDAVNNKRRENFENMLSDPSKRPRVQSDKADLLEKEYQEKANAIKEKYKNVQRQKYSDAVETKYTWVTNRNERSFYGILKSMRAGDDYQWQRMVKGDTSNGLYNDADTTGDPDLNDERQARVVMNEILKTNDAYYSGDKRQLYYQLALIDLNTGRYLDEEPPGAKSWAGSKNEGMQNTDY